jgi:hypothetical protein
MSYDGEALEPGSTTLASQVDLSSSQGEPGKRMLTEALSPQIVAEATPASAVQMRSGDARHDSHVFSAERQAGEVGPGRLPPLALVLCRFVARLVRGHVVGRVV